MENDLIRRVDGEFVLTEFGAVGIDDVGRFEATIETASQLAPVLEIMGENDIDFNIGGFATATVTELGGRLNES